ncbi:Na-translocating system protein MpsC family protein [Metabacillus mangrovi]|uniref:Na-translocating system protein MpsC family protein n=1 Tax=Metabacillus mangrovi TaxID=1491830 RepID=UPI001F4F21A4|nr:Na-translocating system protein MpsC family protein [Metabacillus mangrovi]
MALNTKEKELGSYIGKLLRDHFGKGPGSVFAAISHPYVTVYIKDFLTPMENKLLDSEQDKYVQKIRDMLMEKLIEEIKAYIKLNIDIEIEEFYYDWNLSTHTGMFTGIAADSLEDSSTYPNQQDVHNEIIKVSIKAEKAPGNVYSSLLNPRTLIVVRKRILTSIEKEIIQLGYPEILTLAKRNLEKGLIDEHKNQLQSFLDADFEDIFASWDFDRDKSVFLFILKPNHS